MLRIPNESGTKAPTGFNYHCLVISYKRCISSYTEKLIKHTTENTIWTKTENTMWGKSRKYMRGQMLKILKGHIMNHHMLWGGLRPALTLWWGEAEGRPTSCGPLVFSAFAYACIFCVRIILYFLLLAHIIFFSRDPMQHVCIFYVRRLPVIAATCPWAWFALRRKTFALANGKYRSLQPVLPQRWIAGAARRATLLYVIHVTIRHTGHGKNITFEVYIASRRDFQLRK